VKSITKIMVSMLLTSYANAGFGNDIADKHAKESIAITLLTSENIISSGHYTFGDLDMSLDTHFIPFTYQFDSSSNLFNFYATGSAGFSKYRDENQNLGRGTLDTSKIFTYAVKAGGGIRVSLSNESDLMFGGAYTYSKSDTDFISSKVLNKSKPNDKVIDEILNGDEAHHTYELSTSIEYRPTMESYQPYLTADIRYFYTKIDTPYTTLSKSTSIISKLKAGIFTPMLTQIYDLPFKMEFYTSAVFLSGDIDDSIGNSYFLVAGTTAHLGTRAIVSWVDEVTFDVNIVKGKNMTGLNFGLGLSF